MTVNEQIELLFSKDNYEIVRDHLNGDWESLDDFFTLTLQDFHKHVDSLNLPFEYIFNKEGSQDGLYVLKKGSSWQLIIQEHGQCLYSKDYKSYLDAKRAAFERDYRRGINLKSEEGSA